MVSSPKSWGPVFLWGCLAFALASARPSYGIGAGECAILGLDALATEYSDIVRDADIQFRGREAMYAEFMAPDSLAGRYPDFARVLARLEFGMLVSRHFADNGRLSAAQVVESMIERRNRLAAFADGAGELFKSEEAEIAEILRSAARKLRVSNEDAQQFLQSAREKSDREQAFADADSSIGGLVFGYLGELQVAMRVSGLVSFGRRVRSGLPAILGNLKGKNPNSKTEELQDMAEEVVRMRVASHLQKQNAELMGEDLERKIESLVSKEIDVIFRGRSGKEAWGEVKNLRRIVGERGAQESDRVSSRNLESIIEQAQATKTLIEALATETGPIEQHLFVMNGITRGAARRIQNMGIVVHGVVD